MSRLTRRIRNKAFSSSIDNAWSLRPAEQQARIQWDAAWRAVRSFGHDHQDRGPGMPLPSSERYREAAKGCFEQRDGVTLRGFCTSPWLATIYCRLCSHIARQHNYYLFPSPARALWIWCWRDARRVATGQKAVDLAPGVEALHEQARALRAARGAVDPREPQLRNERMNYILELTERTARRQTAQMPRLSTAPHHAVVA